MESLLYTPLPLVVAQGQPCLLTVKALQPLDPDTHTFYRLIRDEGAAADASFTINGLRFGYAVDMRPAQGLFTADSWPTGFISAFHAQKALAQHWQCLLDGADVLLIAKQLGPLPTLTILNGTSPLLASFDLENMGESSSELLEVGHPELTATAWAHPAPRLVDMGAAAGHDHPLQEAGMTTLTTAIGTDMLDTKPSDVGGVSLNLDISPLWASTNHRRQKAMLPTTTGIRRVDDGVTGLVLAPRVFYTDTLGDGNRKVSDLSALEPLSNWPFCYVVPARLPIEDDCYTFDGEMSPLMDAMEYRTICPQTPFCGLTWLIVPETLPYELVALSVVAILQYANQQFAEPIVLGTYTKPEDMTLNGLFQFVYQLEDGLFTNLELFRINLVGIRTDTSALQLIQQGPVFKPLMHLRGATDHTVAVLDDHGHLEIVLFTQETDGRWASLDLPIGYQRLVKSLRTGPVWELTATEPTMNWQQVHLSDLMVEVCANGLAIRICASSIQ